MVWEGKAWPQPRPSSTTSPPSNDQLVFLGANVVTAALVRSTTEKWVGCETPAVRPSGERLTAYGQASSVTFVELPSSGFTTRSAGSDVTITRRSSAPL